MNIRMKIFQFMHFVPRVNLSVGKYRGSHYRKAGMPSQKQRGAHDKLSGAPLFCQPETSLDVTAPTKEVLINAVQR